MNKDKVDKAIELMENEKTCIIKADTCDRNCAKCELLRDTKDLLSAYDLAIRALERTKWIPCSERLPEESSRYLVTRGLKACNSLWNRVYIVNYSDLMGLCKEKIWWNGNAGKPDFERYDDVIAWMPLPKPYKAESEE